jgi:hypothetical protein
LAFNVLSREALAAAAEMTCLSTENASLDKDPIDPIPKTLVASAKVWSVMHADHIEMHELLAELDAILVQFQKNASF